MQRMHVAKMFFLHVIRTFMFLSFKEKFDFRLKDKNNKSIIKTLETPWKRQIVYFACDFSRKKSTLKLN